MPAASEVVVSEVPAAVSQAPAAAAVADDEGPLDDSDEDDGPEGLIEGIVNTFTLGDGDGKWIVILKFS